MEIIRSRFVNRLFYNKLTANNRADKVNDRAIYISRPPSFSYCNFTFSSRLTNAFLMDLSCNLRIFKEKLNFATLLERPFNK